MADGSKIEWTDATWNPITGCSVVSPGCTNCYAMRLAGTRLRHLPSRKDLTVDTKAGPVWNGEVRFNEQWLDQPLRWKRPRRIFVCAHGDLFAEGVPDGWIMRVLDVMGQAPQHMYQVLTKRPERMLDFFHRWSDVSEEHDLDFKGARGPAEVRAAHPSGRGQLFAAMLEVMGTPPPGCAWPLFDWAGGMARWLDVLPHIWLGVSVEDQTRADQRRPAMQALADMGWLTWVSYEPALGAVDWRGWEFARWIVSGGESGRDARPSHPDWHRATRDFCAANDIAYLFKQWGAWKPTSGCDSYSNGPNRNMRQFPASDGIAWLADGRICIRDFTVAEHQRRIRLGVAHDTRAVEVDHDALAAFHASVEDDDRETDNPLGYQWMYRVGKERAGRLLDGREHDDFPKARWSW